MATTAAPTTVGKIIQVIGPVIDVAFDNDHLPELYNAVRVEGTAPDGQVISVTAEVQQHIGRNQVRAVQRVVQSVDKLLGRAGSSAVWTTRPVERYWRDLRTAATHICNVVDSIYPAWGHQTLSTGVQVNAFY